MSYHSLLGLHGPSMIHHFFSRSTLSATTEILFTTEALTSINPKALLTTEHPVNASLQCRHPKNHHHSSSQKQNTHNTQYPQHTPASCLSPHCHCPTSTHYQQDRCVRQQGITAVARRPQQHTPRSSSALPDLVTVKESSPLLDAHHGCCCNTHHGACYRPAGSLLAFPLTCG